MAEFQEVCKQWRRLCMSFEDCAELCPVGCNPVCGELCESTQEDVERFEAAVMSWAAEHPEPVYPTWIDVMKMYGVTDETGYCYLDSAYKPIPADIAEKLGVEPKEGT